MKKRVLVVHPILQGHGGGQAVSAWTLQALRDSTELTLLTKRKIDYDDLNRYYGTSLKSGDFQIRYAPLIFALPFRGELLSRAFLTRRCRRLLMRQSFDVVISTQNEFDFGTRGIQYVHFPWSAGPRPASVGTVALYWRFCNWIGKISRERVTRNVTLTNSEFIRDIIRETYQIDATVVHPPVAGGFPDVPWEQREDSFVGLGRQAPEKNWPQAVAILRKVRESGHPVRFTLIGSPDQPETVQELAQLAQENSDWFTLHTHLPREQLVQIIARHRYGIHPMVGEHFGIAIAELQRAGCIPFVHRSGGPMEIAGFDDRLMFEDTSDAASKISRVLEDDALQSELATQAAIRAKRYTSETFMREMQRQVNDFTHASR
jgi:glycosyltransferase involved in cell wall biosynthesis